MAAGILMVGRPGDVAEGKVRKKSGWVYKRIGLMSWENEQV